jgi:hypothetical protein
MFRGRLLEELPWNPQTLGYRGGTLARGTPTRVIKARIRSRITERSGVTIASEEAEEAMKIGPDPGLQAMDEMPN